jgi:hypothetical protein
VRYVVIHISSKRDCLKRRFGRTDAESIGQITSDKKWRKRVRVSGCLRLHLLFTLVVIVVQLCIVAAGGVKRAVISIELTQNAIALIVTWK